MKKNYFLILISIVLNLVMLNTLLGQSADLYTFTPTASVFTPLVAGTNMSSIQGDDLLSASTPIGFTFFFEGLPYTTFKASSNGFLSFGSGTASNSLNSSFVSASSKPLLAPMWDDLDGGVPSSAAAYVVTGTAPNRVLTMEWLNYEMRYGSSVANVSFQVKLYETTNAIEYVYRDEMGTLQSPSATIGIMGTTSYLTLNNTSSSPVASSTSFTTSISSPPASGQIYKFSIPEICLAPNGVTVDSVFTTSAYLSWFDQSRRWYFDYEYGPRGFTPGTGISDSTRGTNIMLSALAPGQDYDFYIRNYCNLLDSSILSSPIPFSTIPTCFVSVASSLADSGTGITSTYLSWNDTNSTSSSTWVLSYGVVGFNPDSGTIVLATSNPFNLTGLSGGTTYEWYVRSICAIGDSSNWSASSSFTTDCSAFSTPFSESFESFPTTTSSAIGNCWSTTPNNTTSLTRWNLITGTTPSFPTGPSGAFDGSKYIYLETSQGSSGNVAELYSPFIDLTGLTTPLLNFQTHLYGSTCDTLRVDVYNGSIWTEVFKVGGQQQSSSFDAWTKQAVSLSGYSGIIKIRFSGTRGSSFTGDISIDNIKVINTPNCFAPNALTATNVTGSSADLGWTDNNTSASVSWQISYGPVGFTPGSGTQVTASTNPFTVTGLMGSTTYDWYVRASCTPGDTSTWSPAGSFITPCPTATLPYLQDYSTWVAPCWTNAGGSYASNWLGTSGMAEANFFSVSTGDMIMTSEKISISANARLKFDRIMNNYGGSATDYLYVEVREGAGAWTPIFSQGGAGLATVNNGFSNTNPTVDPSITETIILDSATYTNKVIQVRFRAISGYGADLYIDNLIIEEIPTCFAPNALTATNVTGSSADLGWTDNNTSASVSWQISYGTSGFTAGSGLQTVTATNPTSISGLAGSTTYDWYVRSICTVGDTSGWSSVSSFTTDCPAVTVFPYTENFDGSLTAGVWDCWKVLNIDGGVTWRQDNRYITPTHSTPFSAYGSGNANDFLITPKLSLATGTYRVKFWDKVESGSYPNTYMVLVSTTGSAAADFTDTLTTITTTQTAWLEHVVNLTGYSSQDIYVAFHQISSASQYWGFGIDDFSAEKIPTCTPGSALSGYNPTQVSHDVTWTPGVFDVSWEVEYGAPGYTAGTGNLITGVTNDSLTIAGLISGTSYDVYYRGICSAGDTGAFIGPLTITTPIFPIAFDTTVISSCYTFTTPIGGVTHTSSNSYFDTIRATTPHLYDSAISVYQVTINKLKTGLLVTTGCDGVISASGKFYNVTGVYLDSLPSFAGCDSITTIDLTITYTEYFRDTVFACDSNDFRGMKLTTSGVYSDTLNTGACDKIYIRHLTVAYASYETFNHFVCDSFVSPSGKVWKLDGTYMDTIMNASGCDSVMTFNLTFGYISYSTITPTSCDMYTSPSGKVWTTSGTYLDTIVNASGCDSAMTFNLTINYSSYPVVTLTVCDSYTRPGGTVANYSNTYIDSLTTALGCDSVITTVLTVNYTTYSTISPIACGTYTSPSGNVWISSGTRYDTITNTSGCDSLMTISLTIKPVTSETRTIASCFSYTVPETGSVYTTSGTYTDVSTNAFGCPHTITTILTVNTANAGTISVSGITMTSSVTGVSYKWVDCDNNYSFLLKDTLQSYTPPRNGNYSCWITTLAGCSDTAAPCVSIESVSLEEYVVTSSDISIFPNPANDFVTIDILNQNDDEDIEIRLFDTKGKLVHSRNVSSKNNKVTFDVSKLAQGVYTVTVFNEFFSTSKKVIIVK